ncbi:MAG TPA: hypothetical protein PKX17_00450 [Candidatus Methanomethylicus sp.]|nr:hypothetical protein [Candidatus Methanomethylicus sp.]
MSTDIIHPVGSHPEWNESFYFNFYDRENEIFAFMRIGLKPNRNEKNVFCCFLLPDGSLVGMKDNEPMANSALKAKGLSFVKILPEKKWALNFNGYLARLGGQKPDPVKVSFSIGFECMNEVFNYRECVSGIKEQISQSVASEHLEQFGKVTGALSIGGSEYLVKGMGERDHSWGVRDWNAPKMWVWLTCQFSEEYALNVTKLVVPEGEVDAGFIHLKGRNVPLVKAEIQTEFAEVGPPKSLRMVLTDKEGVSHKVTAVAVRQAALPFQSDDGRRLSVLYEPLARYEYNGMVGYGVAEYLVKKF